MNSSDSTRRLVFVRGSIEVFLVFSTLLLISTGSGERAGAATPYNLCDLGTINGDTNSFALAINSSGQIAGFATVPAKVPLFWTNYSSAPFELPQAGSTFRANGLNNAGQIVGGTTDNQAQATFWTNSTALAFYLDASGQPRSEADAINSAGAIVGRFSTLATLSGGYHYPCFWTNNSSSLLPLDYLGGTNGNGSAHAINDSGEIVGETGPIKISIRATYWHNSSSPAVDLGTLGGTNSAASSINSAGQIVGGAADTNQLMQAAFWTNGASRPVQLPPLGTGTNYASCINNLGQIVGVSETVPTPGNPFGIVAILWTNLTSAPMDLNAVIPPDTGLLLVSAYAINDSGEIVGFGTFTNNGTLEAHAYALLPINPRPPTLQYRADVNQLTLAWPTNLGWILQIETNDSGVALTPTNLWHDVPGSSTHTNMLVTINQTNPPVFYRLRNPNALPQ